MIGIGIKSGRNGVIYEQEENQSNFNETSSKRMLIDKDEIEDYNKEKERLKFNWEVTYHDQNVIEFKIKLKNDEIIS